MIAGYKSLMGSVNPSSFVCIAEMSGILDDWLDLSNWAQDPEWSYKSLLKSFSLCEDPELLYH
jgi:hypothetical protein